MGAGLVAFANSACGSGASPQQAGKSTTTPQTAQPASPAGAEAILTKLYSDLKRGDYASACSDYAPSIQATVILAAKQAASAHSTTWAGHTCPSALAFISRVSPASRRAEAGFGPLKFVHASVIGHQAILAFTTQLNNGLVAHSTALVLDESGRWLVGHASSLTFTRP